MDSDNDEDDDVDDKDDDRFSILVSNQYGGDGDDDVKMWEVSPLLASFNETTNAFNTLLLPSAL